MAEPLGYEQRGTAHFHKQARVAVTNVVYADALDAAGLAGVFHLAIQEAFRVREQPVSRLKPKALAYILPETVAKNGGYGHCASALFGLWR